jgi:hypothetical protein
MFVLGKSSIGNINEAEELELNLKFSLKRAVLFPFLENAIFCLFFQRNHSEEKLHKGIHR